jgi:hypothetical protein
VNGDVISRRSRYRSGEQPPQIAKGIAMHVIAKMGCTSVEDYGYSRKIKFSCVHDSGINVGESPENRSFTKATPSGEAWMTVDNKHVWPAFRLQTQLEDESWQQRSEHYVVFIDARDYSLADVHRALAALDAKDD